MASSSSVGEGTATALAGGTVASQPPSLDDALSYWIGLSRLVHRVCVSASPSATPDPTRDDSNGSAGVPLHFTRYTLQGVLLCCGIKQHRVRQTIDSMLAHLLSAAYAGTAAGSRATGGTVSGVPVVLLDSNSLDPAPCSHTAPTPAPQLPVPLPVLVADWLTLSATADEHSVDGGDAEAMRHRYRLCVPSAAWRRSIIKCLGSELRGQMISLRPLLRWNVACAQQTGRTPVVLFVGGTSGAGKSTLASLVASQLRIPTVLSTDTVRQVLRGRLRGREAQFPALFVSTYEAHEAVLCASRAGDTPAEHEEGGTVDPVIRTTVAAAEEKEHNTPAAVTDTTAAATKVMSLAAVVAAYEVQCELVLQALDGVLARLLARRESVVVEGVHLLPRYVSAKRAELLVAGVACVPALVRIPKAESHLERLCVRARGMSMQAPSNKYIASFQAIRTIQAHLVESVHAASLPVLVLSNTNVDKSFTVLHHALLETTEYAAGHGWPVDAAAAAEVPLTALAFRAVKDRLVAVVRQRRARHEGTGPGSGTPSVSVAGVPVEDKTDVGARESSSSDALGGGFLPALLSATGCLVETDNSVGTTTGSAARARSAELLGAVQRRLLEQGACCHHHHQHQHQQQSTSPGGTRAEAAIADELTPPLDNAFASPSPVMTTRGVRDGWSRSSCHSAHFTAPRTSQGGAAQAYLSPAPPSRCSLGDGSEDFDELEMPSLLGS